MPNLLANWNAPPTVHALCTTRHGGLSLPPYDNNLALHVSDNQAHVLLNRQALKIQLNLTKEPEWLNQTHSHRVVVVEDSASRHADASVTREPNRPLCILTADCLPVLLCNQSGTEVAAIHAGWRGLADHIIEQTLEKMQSTPDTLMAWIGPAICSTCYPIGEELYGTFSTRYPFTIPTFSIKDTHRHADLPKMAELILHQAGVPQVFQSGVCSFEAEKTYYSYRRAAKTGRMGTLIWFDDKVD